MPYRCDGYEDMTMKENRAEIDRLTQWVCFLMEYVDNLRIILPQSETLEDLYEWWEKHKEADRQRRKDEEEQSRRDELIRTNALAKLNDYEKKLLGLG